MIRNRGESDVGLSTLHRAMEYFYEQHEIWNWITKVTRSDVFLTIYRELGFPTYFGYYRAPVGETIWVPSFRQNEGFAEYVNHMQSKLQNAKNTQDSVTWDKLKHSFYDLVITARSGAVRYACWMIHRRQLREFVEVAEGSSDAEKRKDALLSLVELDSSFLTASFARKILRIIELTNDVGFRSRLSRILDHSLQSKSYERQRQRFALRQLSFTEYSKRPYSEWADLFAKYNSEIESRQGDLEKLGFRSYEDPENIKKACQEYGIEKIPAKRGRKPTKRNRF